jgi:hypothetical protein
MLIEVISFLVLVLGNILIGDCNLLTILGILAIIFSWRLICNGAIILHGLGHTIAIAIIDRDLSVVKIENILEHRQIEDVIQSLLPGNNLLTTGATDSPKLWLIAGDTTPWRIRLKAMGGIAANLIAVAVVIPYLPEQNLQNLFRGDLAVVEGLLTVLTYSWLIVNLAIAAMSLTDILALFSGLAEYFYCGNFGFICQRNEEDDENLLLPERMISMYYQMGRETEIRGEQAGGGLVTARDRQKQVVFVGKKIVNRKRDNLTNSLENAFFAERQKAKTSRFKPLKQTVTGVWHYRFGTSGPPAVAETHWHEWVAARSEKVWQLNDGQWHCQMMNVNHRITHNGDFDSWHLYGNDVSYTELNLWLEKVLETPNERQGDSPLIAGMMDFLITQGIWHASVRLGYYLAIANSLNTEEQADINPSAAQLRVWGELFEQTFLLYRRLLAAPNSPSWNQYLCRLEHDILQAIAKDETMSQWDWQKRVNFVRTAIHAFFHNDPYLAVKTFMSGAEGSFGLVVVSTLDRERLILSAQGQPISIGFNWQEGYMIYASEPAAVDAVLLNLPESYRLDLDQKTGEIARVSANEITVYALNDSRELTPGELRERWLSMTDCPYLPHVKYPKNDSEDPVATDNSEIPAILEEIKLNWQNPNSLNRQTAEYLVQLICDKAQKLEQKRQQMMRAGFAEMTEQLPTVDLLIIGVENSLWLGTRFARDFKTIFPWFNIQSISANEILQKFKYDFSSLHLGRDSIVLAITQSGQTFPTIQAINTFDRLYRLGMIEELFILTGELGSFLGSHAIKPKQIEKKIENKESTDFVRHKIFVNGSGRRTAEPATITVAANQQTFTELLLYIATRLRAEFPDINPFGMTLATESIQVLEKMKNDFLDVSVVQIIGTTPTGKTIESQTRKQLITNGRQWAWHVTETPLAWAIHALYVSISVGWAIPFGYTIPLAKTLWHLVIWLASIPQDWWLIKIMNPVIALIDIGIYIFGSWLWTLALRYFQGRELFARIGKRSLVIGDVPWVNQILKNYVSKLFALSYGIASIEVHGANAEDDLLHDFGHRVVRGTLLFLGVPDGRRSQKLKQKENAVIMTGKQADGVRNINVGPEVVVMGSNPEIAKKGFSNAIVLESNDDYFYFHNDEFYFQNKNAEEQKALVEELRESRFSAFERLLASYIFFWALAQKVATLPLLKYQHWKSQSRTKIMTTAAPVTGISLHNSITNNSQKATRPDSKSKIKY